MPNGTKDRILEAALAVFARDGYAGANLKDIAQAVGVVKSAFYRHYASKDEVWNAVLDEMERYYSDRFGSEENLPAIPQSMEELKTLTLRMVNFTIHDEKIVLTRKLLLMEQFHDERVKQFATRHFISGTRAMFKSIFEKMMEAGLLITEDVDMLAFAFTAPITALIHYCDREPDKEPEIMEQLEAFIKHFICTYGVTADKDSFEKHRLIFGS